MENFNSAINAINIIKQAENIMRDMTLNATNYNDAFAYENIESQLNNIRMDIAIACGICTRNFYKPCIDCMACQESEWA